MGKERALLVEFLLPEPDAVHRQYDAESLLSELQELVETIDIEVAASRIIKVRSYNAKLLCGAGKAEELIELAKAYECNVIVFDNTIGPGQQRNWEKLSEGKIRITDREEIILAIFEARAQTKEAVLQVELAHMEYMLPRLKRAWTHLSRQRGGSAMQRGVGETQLEIDQRLVRKRISHLKRQLAEVTQHREVQRKRRINVPIPSAAIVGYTNAGKSSLLNHLTGSKVLAEDKLFATLDPTARRLALPSGKTIVLGDTVGFVRALPHSLVDAFKATLEEALIADFLIHVVDASSPEAHEHIHTTKSVLAELGAAEKPAILLFNKIDRVHDEELPHFAALKAAYPNAIDISAHTGEGTDQLYAALEEGLQRFFKPMSLLIPHDRYELVAHLHELGAIRSEKTLDEGVLLEADVPARAYETYKPFEH